MVSVSGITIPDSKLARDVTQFIRDTEDDLLFPHSSRVFFWGGLTGARQNLRYDSELALRGRHVPRHWPDCTLPRQSAPL